MINSAKVLTWVIGGYIVVKILGYSEILAANPSLRILFAIAPLCLLAWQGIIINNCPLPNDKDYTIPLYERIGSGNWWRIFWILWIGHKPLASDYLFGFYLFSGLVAILVCLIAFTVSVEYYRMKTVTPLIIGCLLFGFFLLVWEKNTFVIHYGVPVVGHLFEKPKYDAIYRVEVGPEDSNHKIIAIADIHVTGRTESEHDGEDVNGNPITHIYAYRDIWIRQLYFPGGGTVEIKEQNEPLQIGGLVHVKDSSGHSWHVQLLEESASNK